MDDLSTILAGLLSLDPAIGAWWDAIGKESARIRGHKLDLPDLADLDRFRSVYFEARAVVGEGPWPEYYRLFGALADIYLEGAPQQRQAIRDFFDDKSHIRTAIHGYVGRATNQLRETGAPVWLSRALAATAIEDQRIDFRDTLVRVGELYTAAVKAGIDPHPYFQAVAAISNPVNVHGNPPGGHNGSTQHMLANFKRQAHFRADVAPRLHKPDEGSDRV